MSIRNEYHGNIFGPFGYEASAQVREVKADGIAECLHYPGTDDAIKSKIDQTNDLIHKLQQTLNEIRRRSQPSTPIQGLTTTDTETEKTTSLADAKSSTSEFDKEAVPNQRPVQEKVVVEVTSDNEGNLSSPKSCVISHNEPVMKPPKPVGSYREDALSDGMVIALSGDIEEDQELPRPKTRRSSKPDEICPDIERFQNTPKVVAEAPCLSDTEFQILQVKLNTINEQTESDVTSLSEIKHIPEEHDASASSTEIKSNDSKSRSPPTASLSTQCGNSPNLAIENAQHIDISPKTLKKTTQLVVQLLPPVNIGTGPALQKIICFSIDPNGKTNLQFRSEGRNVGYFETESSSLAASTLWEKPKSTSVVRFYKTVLDDLSEFDTEGVSNQIEETLISNYYPKELTSPDTERKKVTDREKIPEVSEGLQPLTMLYNEETKAPCEEVTTSNVARNDVNNSSNFNLVDKNPRSGVRSSKVRKSFSDPELYRSGYGYPTSTKREKPSVVDKDLVYKSFQLFKNNIDHDPGSLSMFSADLISNIDDAVYRTYINPDGFNRQTQQYSNSNKVNQKLSTLGKLSSLKFSASDYQMKKQPDEPVTDKQMKKQSSPTAGFSENASKLHNIGLYSSKSSQSTPLDEVALILKKRGKLFLPEPDSSSSEISMVLPIPTAADNISYETISLTVSYWSDESSNDNTLTVSDPKAKYPSTAEQEYQIGVIEPLNSINSKKNFSLTKSKSSHIEIPQDMKKFKELKKKINEEHNIVPTESLRELTRNDSPCSIHDINESIPNFITGLIDGNIDDLHKVIPHVRKTVRGAKKKMSLQPIDKKGSSNSSYTVQTLEVLNAPDFNFKDHLSISPLLAGKNGRYEDEENIFCENNYPSIEETLERRFKFNPENLQRTKPKVDSSNSDTITSEKSLSEGEIQCRCSISIGEMHTCRASKNVHHRPSPLQRESTRFRKKKTYFDNCVTYYFNKNVSLVNDSSSTS